MSHETFGALTRMTILSDNLLRAELRIAALRRKYYAAVVVAAASSIGWFVCLIGEYYA